jgi:hypothetical protein
MVMAKEKETVIEKKTEKVMVVSVQELPMDLRTHLHQRFYR